MNTDKIKRLVNEAEGSLDADNLTEAYLLLDAIRAELDKAPKVLTVEEAINAVRDCYAAMGWTQHHEESELHASLTAAMEAKTRNA